MALTKKQDSFCWHYARNGNATKSAKLAGFSEKTAYSIGHELLKKPEIQARIQELQDAMHHEQTRAFARHSNKAIKALLQVVEHGRSDIARITAANSILDRAGHKPIDRIQSDVKAAVNAKLDGNFTINDAKQRLSEKLNSLTATLTDSNIT
jgi:phage terminase small subunit